jgi:glycosyltransferase involved in cell wall biosynthesis
VPDRALLVSYRLGGPDGVSVQAATWGRALERLGFTVSRVAGELTDGAGPGDVVVPGLSATPGHPPDPSALARALAGAGLVVVENVLSLPMNRDAGRTLAGVLAGVRGRVLLHHHDFAWQRPELAHLSGWPPRLPGAVHVTINDFSRRELAERRGIEATTVRNGFDLDAVPGRREETRTALGLGEGEILVLQPTRAIARKNVPAALGLAEALADRGVGAGLVRYWLPGPAEDGYGPVLDRIVAGARVPVLRQPPASLALAGGPGTMADAYAACDLVVFPSTDEGFGQPVIESVWARRPLAVARYRALDEILPLGFAFLDVTDVEEVAKALICPDPGIAEANLAVARAHFSLEALTERLRPLLAN